MMPATTEEVAVVLVAVVLVAVPYPDSQPAEAENEIARKIEDALNELQSVDFIASTRIDSLVQGMT